MNATWVPWLKIGPPKLGIWGLGLRLKPLPRVSVHFDARHMSFDRRAIGNMLLCTRTSCGILNGMIGIWIEQRCTVHCKGDLTAGVPTGFDYDLRLILGVGCRGLYVIFGCVLMVDDCHQWDTDTGSATRVLVLRAVDCSAMP